MQRLGRAGQKRFLVFLTGLADLPELGALVHSAESREQPWPQAKSRLVDIILHCLRGHALARVRLCFVPRAVPDLTGIGSTLILPHDSGQGLSFIFHARGSRVLCALSTWFFQEQSAMLGLASA